MTKEELIRYGNDYYRDLVNACCEIDEKHKEFVRESIKALEQQPCDNAISRQAALKELRESAEHHANDSREVALLRRDRDIIRALPPVTPQKYGHWIWNFDKGYCKCSECGIGMGHKEFDYCPNCGAKMQESEEQTDAT